MRLTRLVLPAMVEAKWGRLVNPARQTLARADAGRPHTTHPPGDGEVAGPKLAVEPIYACMLLHGWSGYGNDSPSLSTSAMSHGTVGVARARPVERTYAAAMANDERSSAEPAHLLFEVADGIAWRTMNRPDKRNASSPETVARLADAGDTVAAGPSIRVAVLADAGDRRCSPTPNSDSSPPCHRRPSLQGRVEQPAARRRRR